MNNETQTKDKSVLAIPGGTVLGIGVGLFFFPQGVFGVTSVFAFIGCTIIGLGIGLFTAAMLPSKQ